MPKYRITTRKANKRDRSKSVVFMASSLKPGQTLHGVAPGTAKVYADVINAVYRAHSIPHRLRASKGGCLTCEEIEVMEAV